MDHLVKTHSETQTVSHKTALSGNAKTKVLTHKELWRDADYIDGTQVKCWSRRGRINVKLSKFQRDPYFQVVHGTWPQTHWVHWGWWPRACSQCWWLVQEKATAKNEQQERQIFQTVSNNKNVELQQSVIFKANMSNIFWSQLLKCSYLLLFLVIYDLKKSLFALGNWIFHNFID